MVLGPKYHKLRKEKCRIDVVLGISDSLIMETMLLPIVVKVSRSIDLREHYPVPRRSGMI